MHPGKQAAVPHSVAKRPPATASHRRGRAPSAPRGKRQVCQALLPWGTFNVSAYLCSPRRSRIVCLQLMQWPHWRLRQVKQEAFTSLCSSFRGNIAWVSFYLSKPDTQRLYENLICNFLSAFSPLVCRPQTSASLRALNETWHHSIENQDNRHHCG